MRSILMFSTLYAIKTLPSIAGYRELMYQRQERSHPCMIFFDRHGAPVNIPVFGLNFQTKRATQSTGKSQLNKPKIENQLIR